ncbi:MAG: putative DNA binding domain-containing protein [Chitinispirillaceae bacterium]|nr:putative DNA binding domain-containing protein [Chitinispirillaceae bacterium]
MNETQLLKKLDELRALPHETEWLEFKEAKNNYDFKKLGKYFSAISNEANLNKISAGWFIFGVADKTREVCGTNYRTRLADLDSLKHEIAGQTGGITFRNIFVLNHPEGRVVIFEIPPAPRGMPVAFLGHYYGRDGESLTALKLNEIEFIRRQTQNEDWSAGICETATIGDFEPSAILKARDNFAKKVPDRAQEMQDWDDITFLNKARLTVQGKITRTALLLLGREESEHFLSPGIAKISWFLKGGNNQEKDYTHFGPPFLINIEKVYRKIRNLHYRYLLDNTLFPTEVLTYEPYVIREALNNCIAHQDYFLRGRIQVVESPENLLFTNVGTFLPGSVDAVIEQDSPQEYYRNHFLAQAMVNLNLIDTQGGGIKRMFSLQMHRYFPLPDYDLTEPNKVKVKIIGKVIDENYTRVLMQKTNLNMQTVILLDRVQKKVGISNDDAKKLKKELLIEGRYPNVYVSAKVASVTGKRAEYIRNRPFDDNHFKKMVIEYLRQFNTGTKQDFDNLLMEKLSDVLDDKQKKNKIRNMLHYMAKIDKNITTTQKGRYAKWTLV